MANMLRTMFFRGGGGCNDKALQTVTFLIRSPLSIATYVSSIYLDFSHGMSMKTTVTVDYKIIKARRNKVPIINNRKHNNKRITHNYVVGNMVLIVLDSTNQ